LQAIFLTVCVSKGWQSVNARDFPSWTPICLASHNGNLEDIKRLIAEGVDVNDRCHGGSYSPILYAGARGKAHIVETLVKAGANVDLKSSTEKTALLFAIVRGYQHRNDQYLSHYTRTVVELMKFGASLETAKRCNPQQGVKNDFESGLQLDALKAAIAEGQKYQKGDSSQKISILEAAVKKLQDRTSVRLVGNDFNVNSKAGRLEVYHDGRWGTVCNDAPNGNGDQTDDSMAIVVCRMLGQSGGHTKVTHDFGPGADPIWLDNVDCQGDEKSLFDCQHRPWGVQNCGHHEDVGIVCN